MISHLVTSSDSTRLAKANFGGVTNSVEEELARQQGEISRNPWQQPLVNMIKINWDIAVVKQIGRIGLGIIVRDCWGEDDYGKEYN